METRVRRQEGEEDIRFWILDFGLSSLLIQFGWVVRVLAQYAYPVRLRRIFAQVRLPSLGIAQECLAHKASKNADQLTFSNWSALSQKFGSWNVTKFN